MNVLFCRSDEVDPAIFPLIKNVIQKDYPKDATCMAEHIKSHKIVDRFFKKELLKNLTALRHELKQYEADAFYDCHQEVEEDIPTETFFTSKWGIFTIIGIIIVTIGIVAVLIGLVLYMRKRSSDKYEQEMEEPCNATAN